MGAVTKIEWCHHPFNPWWGCTQVSPLCDRCYAMLIDARWFKRRHWGSLAPRRYFPDANWAEPAKWDYRADVAGCRRRVFCASMADVFNKAADTAVRDRLWRLVRRTPNLDWLLLTKRVGNAARDASRRLGGWLPECLVDRVGRSGRARARRSEAPRDPCRSAWRQYRAAVGAGRSRQIRSVAAMGHQRGRVRRRFAAVSPRMGSNPRPRCSSIGWAAGRMSGAYGCA